MTTAVMRDAGAASAVEVRAAGSGADTPRARRRSGSETRQRETVERFRVTPAERAQITLAVESTGLSRSAYVRGRVLGPSAMRAARRKTVELVHLSAIMAQLGKCGSNLNQIARVLNSGGDELGDLSSALAEFEAACLLIRKLAGGRPAEDVPT